jgi:hypothetical protein
LTLDERARLPALGYIFKAEWVDPFESLISILWKFKKANSLPGHVVARLMGPETHPYEGVVAYANAANVQRLRETLKLSSKTLYAAMAPSSSGSRCCQSFRDCVACVGRGYHSLLHQSPGLSVCPAHRTPILAARRRCRYEAPFIVRAELLETPIVVRTVAGITRTRLQSQSALRNAARASDCLYAALPSTILLLSRAGRRVSLSPTH